MTATFDFMTGHSPQIDPNLCAERRIGYDRVWILGLTMLHYASEARGHVIFPSVATLARQLELRPRTVRTAISILIDSGVIREIGRKVHPRGTGWASIHYEPTWSPTGDSVGIYTNFALKVDKERCKREHVGVERVMRIKIIHQNLRHASVPLLSDLTGIKPAIVRKALRIADLTVTRKTLPGPSWKGLPARDQPLRQPQSARRRPQPTQSTRTPIQSRGSLKAFMRWMEGYRVYPGERIPPFRALQDGSPMDSALEFHEALSWFLPNTTVDTYADPADTAERLETLRSQFGHGTREEMNALQTVFLRIDTLLDEWEDGRMDPFNHFLHEVRAEGARYWRNVQSDV